MYDSLALWAKFGRITFLSIVISHVSSTLDLVTAMKASFHGNRTESH